MKVRGYESITKVPSKIILYCTRRYFRTFVRIEGTFVRKYESTETKVPSKVLSYFLVRKYFRTSRSTVQFHYTYVYCTTTVLIKLPSETRRA